MSPSLVASLPPSALQQLPALSPPDSVVPNFEDPPDKGSGLYVTAGVFYALMILFFVKRIYTKAVIVKKASWDDGKLFATEAFLQDFG
jgi:hypothetical protein